MTIEFKCQGCQKTLRVPDEFAGRKAKCPSCQTVLQVPAEVETVEPLEVKPPAESPAAPVGQRTPASSSSYGRPGGIPNTSPLAANNPYASPRQQARPSGKPHRGGLVLGLGVGSVACNFCLIPGILALVFGMQDLKAMQEGRMDPEGHGLTLAGTIAGGIMTALVGLVLLFYLVVIVIGVFAGVAGV